jgi:hypothetical protein
LTRGTPALLALCLTLLLAACSGDGDGGDASGRDGDGAALSATSSPASDAPTSASSPPPPPASPPADLFTSGPAAAERINLTVADVPDGFVPSPAPDPGSAEEEASARAVAACVGLPYVEPVVSAASENFSMGAGFSILQYASQIEFYADEATVAANLAANRGDKVGGCVAEQFQAELAGDGSGETYAPIVVTRLTPDAPGADGAFGLRFTTESDQGTSFTYDVLGFTKDRTEVTLTTLAFDTPTDDADRDALFATLVERGVADAL